MVIPLYDDNPLDRNRYAFVTWGLIALNIVVFLIRARRTGRTPSSRSSATLR